MFMTDRSIVVPGAQSATLTNMTTPFSCQKRNSTDVYSSPGNGLDFLSPTAPSATRVKTYHSTPVDEKLDTLLVALGPRKTTNDTAAQMLRGMIPGCLGPASSARDDLQKRACEIVGSELGQIEKEYIHAISVYDDMIHKLESNLQMRLSSKGDHDIVPHTSAEKSLMQELEQLRSTLTKLRQKEGEAQRHISSHEREMNDLSSRIAQLTAIHNNHYEPLTRDFKGTCQYHVPELKKLPGGEWLSSETNNLLQLVNNYEKMLAALKKLEELLDKPYEHHDASSLNLLEGLKGLQGLSWISEFVKELRKLERFTKAKVMFEELRDSSSLGLAERQSKIQQLIQMFSGLDCEDCLVAGFEPAALECPTKRGPWSRRVFVTLEGVIEEQFKAIHMKIDSLRNIEEFRSLLHELEAKIRDLEAGVLSKLAAWMQGLLDDPKNRLAGLQGTYESKKLTLQEILDEIRRLTEQEPGLLEGINDRRKQKSLLEKLRLRWETLIKTVKTRIASIQAERTKITTALESFRSGPLAAYRWLSDHSHPDFSTMAEASSVGNFESEVREKIRALDDPVKHLQDRSIKSKEMIFCSAPGCLCPPIPHRRPSQADQCLIVGEALKCQEGVLVQIVETQFQTLLSLGAHFSPNLLQVALEAGTEHDGGRAISTLTALVTERDDARKKAALHHSDTVKALADAETGLKAAKREYDLAFNALQTAETLIRTHFIPPRDSERMAPVEADQHISQVLSFLKQQWNLEECLLRGLRPALKHRPGERGTWCVRVVEETEKQIEEKLALLRQEVENRKQICCEWEDKVEAAKREVDIALKEKEIAEKIYQLVREVLMKVKDLSSFRLTALAAYQWLHMRGSSDRAMDHGPLLNIIIKEFDLEVEVVEIIEQVVQTTSLDFMSSSMMSGRT